MLYQGANKNIKTNLSIPKSTFTFNFKIGAAAVFCVAVVFLVAIFSIQSNPRQAVRYADTRRRETYAIYVGGNFSEATNALTQYIQFLESHEDELSRYREVDLLLFVTHNNLAYMDVCSGDESNACYHLTKAYERHKRLRARAGQEAIEKSAFVQFVVGEVEREDSVTNVAWRQQYSINTNTLNTVKAMFLAGAHNAL